MEYLYTGSIVNFNHRVALDLMGLADAYILDGLKYLCENTLMQNVDNDNVIQQLQTLKSESAEVVQKSWINLKLSFFPNLGLLLTSRGDLQSPYSTP